MAEARKPDSCGQCHLGPDHPQHEIYTESKHGNIFGASGENWNWDAPVDEWGPDDISAPTCATCHMGASMMGPDWTHWNGAVDTIMIKLGAMLNDIEMRRTLKKLMTR